MDAANSLANKLLEESAARNEEWIRALREMSLGLIRHLRNSPASEGEPREMLDEIAQRVHTSGDPAELHAISRNLREICDNLDSVAELLAYGSFHRRHDELKTLITTVTTGVKILCANSEELKSTLGNEIENIENLLEEGDPLAAGEKLLSISSSILGASQEFKSEVAAVQTEMESTSDRIKELEDELEAKRHESQIDNLTRLYNRRAFNEMMNKTLDGEGVRTPCALIVVDIDQFKKVNETHGHRIGDALLVKVARTVDRLTPEGSFAARYDGEEFAMLLASASLAAAEDMAVSIRSSVNSARWSYERDGEEHALTATISLGVALLRNYDTAYSVIARADKALCLAKESGGDQVRTELELDATPLREPLEIPQSDRSTPFPRRGDDDGEEAHARC